MGKTSERLELEFLYSAEEELRKIEKNCRKLKSINISGHCMFTGSDLNDIALSKCLVSYEGQLEHLGIHNMKVEELEDVVRQCTSASLDLTCDAEGLSETLKTAGKRLKTVTFPEYCLDDDDSARLECAGP